MESCVAPDGVTASVMWGGHAAMVLQKLQWTCVKWDVVNDFFTKNRVKTARRVGAGEYFWLFGTSREIDLHDKSSK